MLRRKQHPARTRLKTAKPQLPLFEQAEKPNNNQAHLSHVASPPAAGVSLHRRPDEPRLWLCVSLPLLSLEAIDAARTDASAVITSEAGARAIVQSCGTQASAAGIYPGMALTAAYALLPAITVYARQPAAETQHLEALARLAGRYTPVVCMSLEGAGQGVLFLEIAGSVRLFGGVAELERRLHNDFIERGCHVLMAVAPVAKAALWLARSGNQVHCYTQRDLHGLLAALPVATTGWPKKIQQRLQRMGVQQLGACLRLPRDGFARRLGRKYLLELDEALGRHPEVFKSYQPPVVFHDSFDLGAEVHSLVEIDRVIRLLLVKLKDFLIRRQLSAEQLHLQLLHYKHAPDVITLNLREPAHQVERLHELLQLKLDRYTMTAPVIALSLSAATVVMQVEANAGLLADRSIVKGDQFVHLIERLRARLGRASVYSMELLADHRPEQAWRAVDVPAEQAADELPGVMLGRPRPLWLLRKPQRLGVREGRPEYDGRLDFGADCERIETGWWDECGVRRNYYVVRGRQGHRWWIYREQHHWYLHGAFG